MISRGKYLFLFLILIFSTSSISNSKFIPEYEILNFTIRPSDLILLLFIVFFILITLKKGKIKVIKFNKLDILMMSMFLILLIYMLVSILKGYFKIGIYGMYVSMHFPLYYFIIRFFINSKEDFNKVIKLLIIVSFFSAVINISQEVLLLNNLNIYLMPEYTIGETSTFLYQLRNNAQSLLLITFLILIGDKENLIFKNKFIRYFYVSIIFIGLYLVLSRNSFIGWIFGISLFILKGKNIKTTFYSIIIIISIIIFGILGNNFFAGMTSKFDNLLNDPSLLWRFQEIKFAIKSIIENKLLGIGLYLPYRNKDILPSLNNYIHNSFLWVFVNLGIVGFLNYSIIMICLFLNYIAKKSNYFTVILSVSLLSYFFTTLVHPGWIASNSDGIIVGMILGLISLEGRYKYE